MDGVLDDAGSHREIDYVHRLVVIHIGIDQSAGKGIPAAYTVDDVQVILLGEAVLILCDIVQHGRPAVVEGGVGAVIKRTRLSLMLRLMFIIQNLKWISNMLYQMCLGSYRNLYQVQQ